MKFFSNIPGRSQHRKFSGFTLIEMMISVWIYTVIFVGVMVAIQLFGLRVYTLAATKLSATAGCRKALNQIRDSIREAKTLQVGNLATAGSPTTFAAITGNNAAQGCALQLFPTTNAIPYTVYYLDTSGTTNFLRSYIATSTTTNITTLAGYITNTIVFDAEDYQGNIVTNNLKNNQVYRVTMQFYQWEYPMAYVGGGGGLNMYDYYQLRTRICRRALD